MSVPGLGGPFTKAMAAGDAHEVHKIAVNAGMPHTLIDHTGRSFHPTPARGVYRTTEGKPGTPKVIIVAQHMAPQSHGAQQPQGRDAVVARLRALLGATAPTAAPAPKSAATPASPSLSSAVDRAAHAAATSPANARPQPTGGQRRAGNYKKGHAVVGAMDISIENPQGSVRRGTGPDGKPWATKMQSHYGYIRGTKGADKDHVDVFVKPGMPKEMAINAPVFVVDQNKPDGSHDEHKAMIGFRSKQEARAAYLSNYTPGQEKNIGAITEMPMKKFREWVSGPGPQKGSLSRQRPVSAEVRA